MGNEATVAAERFWTEPSLGKIGKIMHPNITYDVGPMYRGCKSIITAKELKACIKILAAYRRFKKRRAETGTPSKLLPISNNH